MQNRLYELGWLLGDRDGNFGTQTQTAVKMFQQAAGLEVTGIADNATLTALYADDAPTTLYADENGGTSATSTPAPASTPASARRMSVSASAAPSSTRHIAHSAARYFFIYEHNSSSSFCPYGSILFCTNREQSVTTCRRHKTFTNR